MRELAEHFTPDEGDVVGEVVNDIIPKLDHLWPRALAGEPLVVTVTLPVPGDKLVKQRVDLRFLQRAAARLIKS
jgi:hypothetical protein